MCSVTVSLALVLSCTAFYLKIPCLKPFRWLLILKTKLHLYDFLYNPTPAFFLCFCFCFYYFFWCVSPLGTLRCSSTKSHTCFYSLLYIQDLYLQCPSLPSPSQPGTLLFSFQAWLTCHCSEGKPHLLV